MGIGGAHKFELTDPHEEDLKTRCKVPLYLLYIFTPQILQIGKEKYVDFKKVL